MNINKKLIFICMVSVIALLTGCKRFITGGNEITHHTFPRVTAIDKGSGPNEEVKLTIAALSGTQAAQQSGGGDGGNSGDVSSANIIQSAGRTVFEANRAIATFSNKDIHWGQNEYIIIGEDAAKEDLIKYLDFFIRNHENRFTVSVVVAKGAQGCDVIYSMMSEEGGVAEKLEELFNSAGSLALSKRIRLSELFNTQQCKNMATILPVITIENKPGSSDEENITKDGEQTSDSSGTSESSGGSQGNKGKKILAMNGFAVFKDAQLFGYIENDMAMGCNIVYNEINSTVLVVKDREGNNVSLEIISSDAKTKVKFEDGIPSLKVEVKIDCNVPEVIGNDDIFKADYLDYLDQQVNDIIKDDIEIGIEYAQKNNLDFFGFSEKVSRKEPVKYEKIKDKWCDIFPTMKIDVEVDTVINRSYNIRKPIRTREAHNK